MTLRSMSSPSSDAYERDSQRHLGESLIYALRARSMESDPSERWPVSEEGPVGATGLRETISKKLLALGATEPAGASSSSDTFRVLARWEGIVLAVESDFFVARLTDLETDMPHLEADILLEEVSPADRSRVELGAIFYWTIGFLDTLGGQRTRESVIRFRSLPKWRSQDLEKAMKTAEEIRDELDWQ